MGLAGGGWDADGLQLHDCVQSRRTRKKRRNDRKEKGIGRKGKVKRGGQLS